MAGLAALAREQGHEVSGSDANAWPPMSDQLAALGIEVRHGYEPAHLVPAPDCVVIGNALSRGNPAVEHVLDAGLAYVSGPEWIAAHVLPGRHVIAVAGTHGKTTTASMLAWVLERCGARPGFLIGGVPRGLGVSARTGAGECFVIEADEYDTAFFDKRSKFLHYRPRTLVLNNLEYDHADIFPDLASIEQQFHHLVRTVPSTGRILRAARDAALERVLRRGCWTPVETFGEPDGDWRAAVRTPDASAFEVTRAGAAAGAVTWTLIGEHNVHDALAATAAAAAVGVAPGQACEALGGFENARRRLELRGSVDGVAVYDDFAHHPTAIRATLAALRARVGAARILALLEPRSNTMRLGVHRDTLGPSLAAADRAWVLRPPGLGWDLAGALAGRDHARVADDVDVIVSEVAAATERGDHVLVMSNGDFGGIHEKLLAALARRAGVALGE